ncbi:DUF4328 domain-containing protein [Streptomyces sp. TRM68416]|uniref:DUF4328 domain-containing protein n=1 Tax=Streptomyces sp. TRM68416 TaxID=2758412 RepID=UPI001661EDEA|nr:DUF4328 domain-containing protein [Streptomyces sp. TRM68416]MBD0839273.1 DUF4328 domain-containing protein [Streptomyces sp. TRM68416]
MIENPHARPIAPAAWLRSPVGLGWAAVGGLGLVIATDLFAVWADLVTLGVTGDLADSGFGAVTDERIDRADRLYAAAGIAQVVAVVPTVVLFLCWFHRARVNAEVFDPYGHRKGRGWAIGGWFVPVVNLWFPRRITADIWDASAPVGSPRSHGLVNAWWAVWLCSFLVGRFAARRDRDAETAQEMHDAVRWMVFSDAVDIVAAALAVAVVLRVTRMQHEKAMAGPAPLPV